MSRRKHRKHSASIKAEIMERLKQGGTVSEVAREYDVSRTLLYLWMKAEKVQWRERDEDPKDRRIRELQRKVASLERVIGRQKLEADFLAHALLRMKEVVQRKGGSGERSSTPKSKAGQRRNAD